MLLLNTSLTVKASLAGSHKDKGWEDFTDKVIDVVDKYGGANLSSNSGQGRGIVFLAWGSWASKRVSKLDKVSPFLSVFSFSQPHKLLTDAGNLYHLTLSSCFDVAWGLASIEKTSNSLKCCE